MKRNQRGFKMLKALEEDIGDDLAIIERGRQESEDRVSQKAPRRRTTMDTVKEEDTKRNIKNARIAAEEEEKQIKEIEAKQEQQKKTNKIF